MDAETLANRSFNTVRKGWDPEEVRPYLQALAAEFVSLADENEALRADLLALEAQLRESKDMEKRVRAMLADLKKTSRQLAQQTEAGVLATTLKIEQERKIVLDQARREADIMLRDAERRAERVVTQGNERYKRLQEQIDLLETKKIALVTRIKSILRAEVDFLAALERAPSGRALKSTIHAGLKTREGLGADELNDIIQRLDQQERAHD
jgi:cell division initiation protein